MEDAIDFFRSQKIPVFTPGDEDYERSVATANLLFRYSRPGCVVQPENASQVRLVVQEANAYSLRITIKCGGHSYAGYSTAREGISLDLRRMNKVKLDMLSKTVSIEAGAQWGNVYKTLVNGGHNQWVINGGRCPLVGTSGFILGGGLGPFSRSLGVGSDTLLEATIVTADGKMVTVKKDMDERPESDKGKLYWALCGAGGGNFGVLVKIKLSVHKLKGEVVTAGRYTWFPKFPEEDKLPDEKKGEIKEVDFLNTMNSFYTAKWPEEMTLDSTWICDLRQTTSFGVRFLAYFDGSEPEFDEIIDDHIKGSDVSTGLAKQLKRRSLPEASTRFLHETLVLQWSEETKKSFPSPTNMKYTVYSSFVFGNDESTMKQVTALIRTEMKTFQQKYVGEKVEFLVSFIHAGDKTTKGNTTAFFWRDAVYQAYVTIEWDEKFMERDMRGFMRRFKKKIGAFALSVPNQDLPDAPALKAAYINFADVSLPKSTCEMQYFGNNYKKLREVKAKWDPEHFFKWDHGVNLPNVQFTQEKTDWSSQIEDDWEDLIDLTDNIAAEDWKTFEMGDFLDDITKLIDLGGK